MDTVNILHDVRKDSNDMNRIDMNKITDFIRFLLLLDILSIIPFDKIEYIIPPLMVD